MKTTKPVSTISFNSPLFLELKLKELEKAGIISFWAFIHHLPEDDECGKKEHNHLFLEPSKLIQTDELKKEFIEPDGANPTKPLGCISFFKSVFSHWYLYALHDKGYLLSKGQTRRYQYKHEEIVSSCKDEILFRSRTIDHLAISPYSAMIDAMEHGISWEQYFARGTVPLNQVLQMSKAWELLARGATFRNGKEGHE